jgi:autotransporter-associated beta strand protein
MAFMAALLTLPNSLSWAAAPAYYWDTTSTVGLQAGNNPWDTNTLTWCSTTNGTTLTTWTNNGLGTVFFQTGDTNIVTIASDTTILASSLDVRTSGTVAKIGGANSNSTLQMGSGNGGLSAGNPNTMLIIESTVTLKLADNTALMFTGGGIVINGVISDAPSTTNSLNTQSAATAGNLCVSLFGLNTFGGGVFIKRSNLFVNSLGTAGTASSVGTGSTITLGTSGGNLSGTLIYTNGTGDTTDRTIDLAGGLNSINGSAIDHSGTGLLKFTHDMTSSSTPTRSLTLQGSTAGIGEFAGVIKDHNSTNQTYLYKAGTGTWILSGANTYSGGTTSAAGKLVIINSQALQNSVLSFAANTVSFTNLTTAYLGGLAGSASLPTNSLTTLTLGNSTPTDAVYSGVITNWGGSLAVIKIGSNKQTFSGANTYSGSTTISNGTLYVNASTNGTGSGTVQVNGGTLGGIGPLSGVVTVNNGGILAPGDPATNTVWTQKYGGLTLNNGAILNFEFTAITNDQANVTTAGGLTLAGGGFNLYQSGSTNTFSTNGVYALIKYSGTLNGAAGNLSVLNQAPRKNYLFSTNNNFVILNIRDDSGGTLLQIN